MDFELVTIGTELLLGHTVDTNGAELGRALAEVGARLVRRTTVGDDEQAIATAVAEALARTGRVITTGGLGPTRDDLSKQVVADLYGWPLQFNEAIWEDIVSRFRRIGRVPAPADRGQAEVPQGAVVLPNRWGTAPGLWLDGPPGLVVMLPGVPREMKMLLTNEVLPRLKERTGGTAIRSMAVRTTSIAESAVASRLEGLHEELHPLTLAYLPSVEGVDLRLTAWNLEPGRAAKLLNAGAERLETALAEHAYGRDDDDLAALVVERLRRQGLRVAVAESCSGGLLGGRITEVPGSSEVFVGGVICYDDRLKTSLIDVPKALLTTHGAVSEAVATAMASGVASRLGTDVALSITGIAGPSGATETKPLGTVWIGYWHRGIASAVHRVFLGSRAEIRARAVQFALHGLFERLGGDS